MDEWVNRWLDIRMNRCMHTSIGGWVNGWMNGLVNEWEIDGWIFGSIDVCIRVRVHQ